MNGYFDYNATAPTRPEVVEAIASALRDTAGNPSSMHVGGRRARALIDQARDRSAALVGVHPSEIYFTSGATESNNLAMRGFARLHPAAHLAAPNFEHHSVLRTLDDLEREGTRVTRLAVDAAGQVAPGALRALVDDEPDRALLVVGAANGESGHITDLDSMLADCDERVVVHIDAAQTLGKIRYRMPERATFLAASAHKFGGPSGAGLLAVREGAEQSVAPLLTGGPQEAGMRAGTENLAGIVGMGVAAEIALKELDAEVGRLGALRDRLWQSLATELGDVLRLTPADGLPNTLTIAVGGIAADVAVAGLDLDGFQVSTGSACAAGAPEPSHVVKALDIDPAYHGGVMRISMGRDTDPAAVDGLRAAITSVVSRARAAA